MTGIGAPATEAMKRSWQKGQVYQRPVCRGLYLRRGGDVRIMLWDKRHVTLKNCKAGMVLPLMPERIYRKGTTAWIVLLK